MTFLIHLIYVLCALTLTTKILNNININNNNNNTTTTTTTTTTATTTTTTSGANHHTEDGALGTVDRFSVEQKRGTVRAADSSTASTAWSAAQHEHMSAW